MQEEYYNSIKHLPLENWFECSDGNLEYSRKNLEVGNSKEDAKAWEIIYNDFLDKIGLSDDFMRYIELIKSKALKQLKFVESIKNGQRNRFILNEIREITARIKNYEKTLSIGGMDKYELLSHLSEMQGYRIDPLTTKTIEYFKMIDKFKKRNK